MGFGPSFQFAKISFSTIAEMKRFARQFDGDKRNATLLELYRAIQSSLMDMNSKCDPLVITKSMLLDEFFCFPICKIWTKF